MNPFTWSHLYLFFFFYYSKMFDIELCPLPFSMEEMFGFISCRFSGYPASVQEQALLWLHVNTHTHTQGLVSSSLPVVLSTVSVNWTGCHRVWVPAEYGSGSQNKTEGESSHFSTPSHTQTKLASLCTAHGSISDCLSHLWLRDFITVTSAQQTSHNSLQSGIQFHFVCLHPCLL